MNTPKTFCRAALLGMLVTSAAFASEPPAPTDSYTRLLREAAVALLKEGNARYLSGKLQHPNLDAGRRALTVAEGQEPFATILACSDSRDPVELIFDRGIGDLFVVRVAGNVAGLSELATVEYGVGHLHTPLLVVMGHTRCGAVTAVVKGAELHGHLPRLAEKISPAAAKAKAEPGSPEEVIPKAIRANVWQTISDVITQSSLVREQLAAGKVQVVGAVYDLEKGTVEWLGSHPDEKQLLAQSGANENGTAHGETTTAHALAASSVPRTSPPASPAPGVRTVVGSSAPSGSTSGPAGANPHY